MKKRLLLFAMLCFTSMRASAADLLEVYQQAQASDPTFLKAIATRLQTKEGVPISAAALLPNLTATATPSISRLSNAGSNYTMVSSGGFINPRNVTQRQYGLALSLTQTVFNFTQFSAVASQIALSRGADATLNAALQDLMIRVASAYFAVLRDEDNLSYAEATKLAYAEQLNQAQQQYKVGVKTLTDVYTAQASYDSAVAKYITAETTLANDRENLRAITGKYYPHLSSLSEQFPLLSPKPADIEQWVQIAERQNWSVKASQYSVDSARQNIRQQFSGHLPTVQITGSVSRTYSDNISGYNSFIDRNGPGTTTDKTVGLNINFPLIAGGGVVAQTNQAIYAYEGTQQQLEQTIRDTVNKTRQSYLNVISGISKVAADKQTIKSTISSLEGLEASYQVGTETLVNVLDQQQKVFEAQTAYATDRYDFVNNMLALKQAAGTLSFNDLRALNMWLVNKARTPIKKSVKSMRPTYS